MKKDDFTVEAGKSPLIGFAWSFVCKVYGFGAGRTVIKSTASAPQVDVIQSNCTAEN